MCRIRTICDIDECSELWKKLMPSELVSDLWEVRACFHAHYRHRPHFIVAEEDNQVIGFLPLSWNAETGKYNYFPGETWEGKTWLEQNRIIANSRKTLNAMLGSLDNNYQLQYLRDDGCWNGADELVDEVGYLFLPEPYGFNVENYFEAFSHKTAKKLKKELAGWNQFSIEWRFNCPDDFDILCEMNRRKFGRLSYFYDDRFLESFRSFMQFLHNRGWLYMVTVIIDGKPAATDMGSLYNRMLTMLAGGIDENFRGIAKLINMHHITYACNNRLDSVDFLCGDFNWKTLFHLTPMPLYKLEKRVESNFDKFIRSPLNICQPELCRDMDGAINV